MKPRVVVAGIGPAGPELLTAEVLEAIERIPTRYLRTARHPSAPAVQTERAFDHLYEAADTFAEVYEQIAAELVVAAQEHGEVLYAVPGSPLVLEHTVTLLRARDDIDVVLLAGLSFLDLAWSRLGVDPIEAGARLVDGHLFAEAASGEVGPLLVAHVHAQWVLSDIKLSVVDPPDEPVVVLQRLGSPDESVFDVAWDNLDRTVDADHLTALWIPRLGAPPGSDVLRLEELMRTLRAACPWDREQTHASLRRHLLEETYEVLEVLDRLAGVDDGGADSDVGTVAVAGDGGRGGDELDAAYVDLEEELGDLLFQVVFHARLAAEHGRFELGDVARNVHDKLVSRHPHIFGDGRAPDAVMAQWELAKVAEKGRTSVMDGIPAALPALAYAAKVAGKAAALGVATDPADAEPGSDTAPGVGTDATPDVAERLWSLVVDARAHGIDPEAALRAHARKVEAMVRAAEGGLHRS